MQQRLDVWFLSKGDIGCSTHQGITIGIVKSSATATKNTSHPRSHAPTKPYIVLALSARREGFGVPAMLNFMFLHPVICQIFGLLVGEEKEETLSTFYFPLFMINHIIIFH
jgi:hypothetical protein